MKNKLLENIRLFLLDIDGVIITGNSLIEGAVEGIGILQRSGARTLFLTNNSTRSRKTLVEWLKEVGIELEVEDILTTAYCAAQYVSNLGLKTVYIIGEKGFVDEFIEARLKVENEDAAECDAVVVGMDRNYNYHKLTTGFKLIQRGAKFIATNTDASLPTEKGETPGAGAMVGSLQGCTYKKPIVLGKPNTYLMKLALKITNSTIQECAIVGDRPETDMAMARKGGCLGIIVLTGVASLKRCEDYLVNQKPHLIYSSLLELAQEYEAFHINR